MQDTKQKIYEAEKAAEERTRKLLNPEQQMAQTLRRKADSIEIEGNLRLIDEQTEKNRLQALSECKIIIPIIEARHYSAKTSYTPIFLLICTIAFVSLFIITKYQKKRRSPKIILIKTI